MILEYNPKNAHRYAGFYRVDSPADVELNQIRTKSITHCYKLELCEPVTDIVQVLVTEENNHYGIVQYFNSGTKTCSCEQYFKHGIGLCKHIAIVDYITDRIGTFEENQFKSIFNKILQKIGRKYTNSYEIYDSYKDKIINIGSGPVIKSFSTITWEKHQYTEQSFVPVVLPDPYVLTPEISLYDYQRENLQKMISSKKAICSMTMGLGKTLTSVGGIKYLGLKNGLIVCPKSVLIQWQKEIFRVLGINALVLSPKNISKFLSDDFFGLCTYQTFARNSKKLSSKKYDIIIPDEIQFIRNNESKTWACFKDLESEYFWGLSGTVIENRIDDLYNIMEIIQPNLFGPKWKFDFRFKKLKSLHRKKVLYHNELQNIKELREKISNRVFSYGELDLVEPDHNYYAINLDKSAKNMHDGYMDQANLLISKSLNSELSFVEKKLIQMYLLKARQSCNSTELLDKNQVKSNSKIDRFLDLIDDFCVKQNSKVVVYSEWTTMLDILQREVSRKFSFGFERLDGQMTSLARFRAIQNFSDDTNCRIFFSSDAGALGIDGLQSAANKMIHFELPWNPAKIDQRVGRLHRLGQKNKVEVHYLYAKDSIESKIKDLLSQKRQVRIDTLF